MTGIRCVFSLVIAGLISPSAASISAANELENIREGTFKATGMVRTKPEVKAERLFCKMTSRKLSETTISVTGRCATATNSLPIELDLRVLEPGKRYRLISSAGNRVPGFDANNQYAGTRKGESTLFTTDVTIEGVDYRSLFAITLNAGEIARITETVTRADNGKTTTLLDIQVKREK